MNWEGHIKQLHEQVAAMPEVQGIKMIVYVEHTVDANDLPTALWRFCNNLDPKRDFHLYKTAVNHYTACMGLDGTRKTKEYDNFHRDWPNIIVADDATIKSVDEKWNALGIGGFIPSPSLKFKDQLYGEEAVVN
jgi:4-hydroxy-3-polyprenylbenzoate decarboxylase